MSAIKGFLQVPKNIPSSSPPSLNTGKEVVKKLAALGQAESPNVSLKKVAEELPSQKKEKAVLSERIGTIVNKGVEYFKEVKDRAIKDRDSGLGKLEGANKLWNELLKEADKIGRASQNKILDHFANETGNLLRDSIKGSSLEKLADTIIPSLGSGKGGFPSTKAGATVSAGASGVLGKVAGLPGAAYSLYQLLDGFGKDSPVASAANGATVGAYIGTVIAPGLGTTIGGVLGGVGGALMGVFGKKKKHPEHVARDQMRALLQEAGFLDKDYSLKLADGSVFSLAVDGKKKLENVGGGSRFGYQFDPTHPHSGAAIGMLQPLAQILTGGDQKLATDLTGYLVNAVTSNTGDLSQVRQNVIAIYEQSGASLEDVAAMIVEMGDRSVISEHHRDAYLGGIMSVADEEMLYAISGSREVSSSERISEGREEKAQATLH